jgi:hypothetical protein
MLLTQAQATMLYSCDRDRVGLANDPHEREHEHQHE